MDAAEAENIIRSHCFIHIRSKSGRTIDTEAIATIEVHGIEQAAKAIIDVLQQGGK